MANESRSIEGNSTPKRSLPGAGFGKGLLIVFAIVTIPACIGIYLTADVMVPDRTVSPNNRGVNPQSPSATAARASLIRLDAAIGVTTSIALLALAFAIDRYPLFALLAASGIFFGRLASFAPALPMTPWPWAWILGLTVVSMGLLVCVMRAMLARHEQLAKIAAAQLEVRPRALVAYYLAYLAVLVTPVATLVALTASSPGPREPLDFLALSALNTAIIAVIVLSAMAAARLPRLRKPSQVDRRAWTIAPFAVCLLVVVAFAYHHFLLRFLPNLASGTDMRDHAHLLLGWMLVGCALPAWLEEWLFRRLAFATIGSLMSAPLAIIVSSTIFASAHALTPLNAPLLFLLGLILGWAHVTTGRLVLPVLLHFSFNFALLAISVI